MKPYNLIELCDYRQLHMHTPVFNTDALDEFFWLKIPHEVVNYQLYQIDDISQSEKREVNFYNRAYREKGHPWIKIPKEIFNLTSGKHTYKFYFYDEISRETTILFMSYISQDDNPYTPYVYMPNRKNPSKDIKASKEGLYSEDYFKELRKNLGLADYTDDESSICSGDSSSCGCNCIYCPYKN